MPSRSRTALDWLEDRLGNFYHFTQGQSRERNMLNNLLRMRAVWEVGNESLPDLIDGVQAAMEESGDAEVFAAARTLFGSQRGLSIPGQVGDVTVDGFTVDARDAIDREVERVNSMVEGKSVTEILAGSQLPAGPPQSDDDGIWNSFPTGSDGVFREARGNVRRADDLATTSEIFAGSAGSGTSGGGGGGDVPFDPSLPEPGTQRRVPGGYEVWRVGDEHWLAYEIPGTNTPLVWKVEDDERAQEIFGTSTPDVDRTLTGEQFKRLSPWQIGGLTSELVNTDVDPWQVFMSQHERAVELRPWLGTVDWMAVNATAYLEGRDPTADEISQTDWWQNHTAAERNWMDLSAVAGEAEVERMVEDQRRSVEEALRQSGASNVPSQVVDYISEQVLTGRWSEAYGVEQIRKVSDPFAPGELDAGVRVALSGLGSAGDARAIAEGPEATRARVRAIFDNRRVGVGTDSETEDARLDRIVDQLIADENPRTFQNLRESVDRIARNEGGRPGGLDVTREKEDTVRQLASRWLGPSIGNLDERQVAEWAGRLRNDPDAEQEFVDSLRQQRLAMLPGYTNANLTYEDIVQPVRNLASQTWGQPIDDEGLLVDLANTMDYTEMAKRLRQQGLERGIAKPTQDALAGLMGTSLGNRVQRSAL